MSEALLFKVAAHAGLEALGGIGVGCLLLLCSHEHFHGRLGFINAIVHSRAYRATVIAVFYLITATLTVALIDPEVFEEGLALAGLAIALHLALEAVGGASLLAVIGRGTSRVERHVPEALRGRTGRAAALAVWYLSFAVLSVTLIPLGHGH